MPLDPISRRYADGLFIQAIERIDRQCKERTGILKKAYFEKGLNQSQIHLLVFPEIELERAEALARAMGDSLISAYEAANLLVGEFEFQGIVNELSQVLEVRKSTVMWELQQHSIRTGNQQTTALCGSLARKIGAVGGRVARDIRIRLDAETLARRQKEGTSESDKVWDVFISYAGPDWDPFARQVKNALEQNGLSVWHAEVELKVGDSLHRAIDRGLGKSRYGVVVLSPAFFDRKWPQSELDGLLALETPSRKVIRPVWYNLNEEEVKRFSPILAGDMLRVQMKVSKL
jgi:hypothetical protein